MGNIRNNLQSGIVTQFHIIQSIGFPIGLLGNKPYTTISRLTLVRKAHSIMMMLYKAVQLMVIMTGNILMEWCIEVICALMMLLHGKRKREIVFIV